MKLAIIGDFRKENATHLATNASIAHSLESLNMGMEVHWIATNGILADLDRIGSEYTGFLIAPGSPYACMEGVLAVIRYARENDLPVLGTGGGFQFMVTEFARNVAGIEVESNTADIDILDKTSITYALLGVERITENGYGDFGLNPAYRKAFHEKGFRVVGVDAQGEARILELQDHFFFVGTLFAPQMRSTFDAPHPLITGFIRAMRGLHR